MALNETQVAIQAAKRLKMDGRSLLSLQTLIPSALNNLARQTASDPNRRRLLVTDQSDTIATIAGYDPYYASLAVLEDGPGIMFDFLQFGTIYYHRPSVAFQSEAVVISPSNYIEIQGPTATNFLTEGTRVRFTTSGVLPGGIYANIDYYVCNPETPDYQFSSSYANAIAGTPITITDAGSGDGTIVLQDVDVCQWLGSPNIASFTSCVPFESANIWLVGDKLYTNKIAGTFQMSVPFIPTLDTLPAQLQNDLIDEVINLATDAGYEVKEESEK